MIDVIMDIDNREIHMTKRYFVWELLFTGHTGSRLIDVAPTSFANMASAATWVIMHEPACEEKDIVIGYRYI